MENRLNILFNYLEGNTKRILQSIISSGTYTIREIREFFKPRDISDEELRELESVETVDELWKYLINREIITMDNVRALRTVAKNGVHSEELTGEVEQYERNVGGIPIRNLQDNPVVLEKFSQCLDRAFPHIKYWVHFAHVMEVNNKVISECKLRSEKSPTVKLFDYLKAKRPQLTIKELISALSDIERNDLCDLIRIFDDEDKVSEVITDSSSEMMDNIALELDSARRPVGNWRNLAQKLELTRKVYDKFGMYSDYNPTVSLVRYLYTTSEEPIPLKRFVDVLKEMDRQDAVDEITKVTGPDAEELYANNILKLSSDLLEKVAELLNKDIPCIEGWQGLARHFRVDSSIIESLEIGPQDVEVYSPTTRIIKHLAADKPSTTITDIVRALQKIQRKDAIKILRVHFNIDVPYDRSNIEDLGITPDPHGLADNETYGNVNTTPFGIQATEQAKRADQKKKIHDDLPCLPKSAGPSVEAVGVESAVKRGNAASNQTDDSEACSSTREEVKKSWFAGVKEYFKQKLGLNSGETGASTQDGNNIDGYFETYENFALHYKHSVFVSDLENLIRLGKDSVGAIITVNVSDKKKCVGTCFRIGTRYVITNKHVIDDIEKHGILLQKCYVDFNYEEQGPADLCVRFATSPELVTSKELDYAILELHPDDKRKFPPSVLGSGFNIAPAGRKLKSKDCLTLIGHPNGAKKQVDVSCPIKDQDDLRQHLTQAQSKLNETDFASHLFCIQNASSHPHVATYDVSTFFHGSSGSPGFLLEEKLLVVLHAGGIPFEGTRKNHVLEYGILMSSVVEDVKSKISTGEIQDVPLSHIFNDSKAFTSSNPEPMDMDQVPDL